MDDHISEETSVHWTPEERLELAKDLWDWTPHPGQRRLLTLRLADGCEPRVLVAACGRRWGKTEAIACDTATRLLTEPDLGQLAVAPTNDQAEILFEAVEEKVMEAKEDAKALERFPHLANLKITRTPYPRIVRKDTGATLFSARTAGRDGRSLRGRGTTRKLKRFRVLIDERAYVPDEAVERALKPMLATVPGGGQLVEISSPNGRRGGFYSDFLKGEREDGRYRAVRLPSSDNPMVDAEFLTEMQEEMTDRAFRAEFLAEFTDSADALFPDSEIDAGIVPDDYGDRPLLGVTYVAGVDFARYRDWTVAAIVAVEAKCLRLVKLVRLKGLAYADQAKRVADALAHWNVTAVLTDATGVGDAATDDLQREIHELHLACKIERFVFSASSKSGLLDRLALKLSHREIAYPPHPDLITELRRMDAATLSAQTGHDDTVIALALALRASEVYAPLRVKPAFARRSYKKQDGLEDLKKEFTFSCGTGFDSSLPETPPTEKETRRTLLSLVYRFALGRSVGASLLTLWMLASLRSRRARLRKGAFPAD